MTMRHLKESPLLDLFSRFFVEFGPTVNINLFLSSPCGFLNPNLAILLIRETIRISPTDVGYENCQFNHTFYNISKLNNKLFFHIDKKLYFLIFAH